MNQSRRKEVTGKVRKQDGKSATLYSQRKPRITLLPRTGSILSGNTHTHVNENSEALLDAVYREGRGKCTFCLVRTYPAQGIKANESQKKKKSAKCDAAGYYNVNEMKQIDAS